MEEKTPIIVTYMVDYYPMRAEQQKMISPESQREELDYHGMCIKDGQIYMVAGAAMAEENGEDVLLMEPGSPVVEIRVSDGQNTRTIYVQGDEVPDKLRLDMNKQPNFRIAK